MPKIRNFRLAIVLTGIVMITGGWGFLVHKTIHQLAVHQLPKKMRVFFFDNMDNLVSNAPRPDTRRNQDSTEASKHFIDLELYGEDAAHRMPMDWPEAVKQYSRDSLLKYGYVPYHILYMKERLTAAFRSRNKDSILFYATDMGHYIGDANVPLHTTANYDGQLSGQKGLHSLWESTIPELFLGGYNLYSPHKATYLLHPDIAIWTAVRRGAALVLDILRIEKETSAGFVDTTKYKIRTNRGREYKAYSTAFARAYAAALAPTINDQLLHAASLIADFWYTSWIDAGKPDLSSLVTTPAATAEEAWKKEHKAYRNNTLIANRLLLSKKTETKETE